MIEVTALLAKNILIQLSFRCEEFIAKGLEEGLASPYSRDKKSLGSEGSFMSKILATIFACILCDGIAPIM